MPTELEKKIIQALRHHIACHGQAPTLEELGKQVGIRSKGTVHRYVNSLIEQGLLARNSQKGWRGIRLTEESNQGIYNLPLLGRIAAGRPIEAIEDQTELNLMALFKGEQRYVLKVQGDSMIDAGILDGDWVVISKATQARHGDIVVALINDEEATLKRLGHSHDNRVALIPENSNMKPMYYSPEQVQIQGVLVGQMRSYQGI